LNPDVDVHLAWVQVEPANDTGITRVHGVASKVMEANSYGDAVVHPKMIDGQAHTARISKGDVLDVSGRLHWIQANHTSESLGAPDSTLSPVTAH
jgi:hypothetical protein